VALAALALAPRVRADRVWPEMHSSQESLLAPTNLYDNAKPFRWAAQRRTDSIRVAIVVHRWDSGGGGAPSETWDSTEVWVMRGDAFGPVNPFLDGQKDPFVVKKLLPEGKIRLRCQVGLVVPRLDGDLLKTRPVGEFTLGHERFRLMTPTLDGGADLTLRTVGHAVRVVPPMPDTLSSSRKESR
jgi:hypothetical protein